MPRTLLLAAFLLAPTACGGEDGDGDLPAAANLAPPPEGQGFQLSLDAVAPPFEEVWICDVYPLPNTEPVSVSWVDARQNFGTHHLTLSTLGLASGGLVEHGRHDCNDLYGSSSLMEDQIMFYGNQGDAESVLRLPEGVAATFPTGLDIIHEVHYVNVTDKPVSLYSRVNAWTMPAEEVVAGIWGGTVRDENIAIPPMAEAHTEWSRCVMNEDVEILFLASHTHAMGTEFSIAPFDGATVGDEIYRNTDWHTPHITQYDPPLKVPAGQGFQWTCTWRNPEDRSVSYGLNASDEMCNLAVVHTPFSLTARCEVVETSDGVLWSP